MKVNLRPREAATSPRTPFGRWRTSMDKLARFMMRNRWWVIVAWIAFMVLTNLISRGLGGANYNDEFKLPHTETQTVSNLLKDSGQTNQNGIDGIMVVHASS